MNYLALATDYDGTLARDGHVEEEVTAALRRLRASGRKIILVTGRVLADLVSLFSDLALCDVVVAENGGLLYWPSEQREEVLAEAPTEKFIQEMIALDVKPFSVGRVVFATWRPHEHKILDAIQRLALGYQIIFNKDAVMVLPSSINKASGLVAALHRLGLTESQIVGVGDAENDHAFLDCCAVSAAVANALPALKARADVVLERDHGQGVMDLIDRLIADDLRSLGPRTPRAQITKETEPVTTRPGERSAKS